MISTSAPEHVSALMAMLYPGATKRCDQCGGFVAMSPEEALRQWSERTYQPLVALSKALQDPTLTSLTGLPTATTTTGLGQAYGGESWAYGQPGYGLTHGHKHRHDKHHHDCGCDDEHDHDCGCDDERHHDCGCDDKHHHGRRWEYQCECRRCAGRDCHCRCCVVNADLVVYVRAGERRIVPLVIDNDRRRERHIRLELSEFASKGGSPASVASHLLSPAEFTLAPHQEREIVIEIDVAQATAKESNASADDAKETGVRLLDVDDCEVAYADLRIVGCDHRPIRIAVATLPRDCHAYHIDCSCGCC
jgi:hypothetical protein